MLTRLEVDGFKNLLGFAVDFGPFNCIAGPNGVGKSNVFDAIRFLSLLTEHKIIEAAQMVRGNGNEGSDLRDLFWSNGVERSDRFRIAAEMIVEASVQDELGRTAKASSTFLRYEIEVGYQAIGQPSGFFQLPLLSETLTSIAVDEVAARLKFPHSAPQFRAGTIIDKGVWPRPYISLKAYEDGLSYILVDQETDAQKKAEAVPTGYVGATIVGTSNTSATPTILAARREMQKWRFLALEPSAMRRPDRFQDDTFVNANGGHLPATLYRLASDAEKRNSDPADVYAQVTNRLAGLVPISSLSVDVDAVRQLLTVQVKERTGITLPAASLSDGTLRFLALSVLVADAQSDGLVCIEEPENGIHPAKMGEMVRLLQDLAVDADKAPGPDNPFRQVIVATHSPVFVKLISPNDVLCAVEAKVRTTSGLPTRTLRCSPLDGTWRSKAGEKSVGVGTLLAYLTDPPGAQLRLPALLDEAT